MEKDAGLEKTNSVQLCSALLIIVVPIIGNLFVIP
jgi:hypothetical protein